MTSSHRKILITGATGFVGQALCKALVGRNTQIQILMRNPIDLHKIPIELGASVILGSLNSEANLAAACTGVDQVVHLAGSAHVGNGHRSELIGTNVEGSQKLMKAASEANVKRFLFLSSTLAVAAENRVGDITDYGKSKLEAEKILRKMADEHEMSLAILRPVNVYGPGMKGNIAQMIMLIDKGFLPPLPLIKNKLSLISSNDLSRAIISLLDAEYLPASPMIVTDGHEYSTENLEKAIYANLGKSKGFWRIPAVLLYAAAVLAGLVTSMTGRGSISGRTYRNLVGNNLFVNDRTLQNLGFQPTETFYQSLPSIIENMRKAAT